MINDLEVFIFDYIVFSLILIMDMIILVKNDKSSLGVAKEILIKNEPYRSRPYSLHHKGGLMSKDRSDGPEVIQFKLEAIPIANAGPSRDELVSMIRKVLSPSELFKMNAPKSRKKTGSVEVIDFVLPAREKMDNG